MALEKFKICITMAGAVSAGAYTAGVIDYLLETLQLWEDAKQENLKLAQEHAEYKSLIQKLKKEFKEAPEAYKNALSELEYKLAKEHSSYNHSIPMHEVELEVLSGASAGGITGTLTVLSLLDKDHRYVNKDNPEGENNVFYQSWVQMADTDQEKSLMKLLATNDLEKGKYPESLLNTTPIDDIADNALKTNDHVAFPGYVSKSLDLVLTTTNLRGLNFNIDFQGGGSVITNHGGFFRYKVANDDFAPGIPENSDSLYYVLDLKNETHVNYLKDATLSTSAFPIGLKSRQIKIAKEYIERYPKYLFNRSKDIAVEFASSDKTYTFTSVDGGLINNEPFGIGMKVLLEKNEEIKKNDNYAVIMVDPFPNQDHDEEVNVQDLKTDIITVAQGMFKALRNQVMFNQDGIFEALSLSDRTKFLVAPTRKQKIGEDEHGNPIFDRSKNDLASSPLSGFGGFLDEEFRKHDFHLGRKNCQSFLRYYFAVSNDNIKKRFGIEATQEAKDRFCYSIPPMKENEPLFFPIIPDMRVKKAFNRQFHTDTYGTDAELPYPEYPKFDMKAFEKMYKKPIQKRIKTIVQSFSSSRILNIGFRWFFQGKAYRIVKDTIEKELKESELLE